MNLRALRASSAGAVSVIMLGAWLVFAAAPAQANTCPTVDSTTGAVTPAPAPNVDWTGCNLTGANLTKADLENANLTDANLYNTVVTSADFTGATFTGLQSGDVGFSPPTSPPTLPTNWQWIPGGYLAGPGANLSNAYLAYDVTMTGLDLAGADLSNANFNDIDVTNTDFTNANLDGATLTQTWMVSGDTLTSATFNGADMQFATISGASANGADFTGVNLQNSALTLSDDFTNANFTNANLGSAKISDTNLTDATLTGAKLNPATLTGDNLTGTALGGATFIGVSSSGLTGTPASLPTNWTLQSGFLLGPTAYLYSADLTDADLSNADLSAANLSYATMTGANLDGTDLTNANLNYVTSGSITGTPAALPANWTLVGGYLFGPTADLYQANLTNLTFGDSDLQKANLQDADVANSNLGDTDMTEATLTGVQSGNTVAAPNILPTGWELQGGFLVGPGADLAGANLEDFVFANGYFSGINFAGADLTSADFANANITGADLDNANLTGATLTLVSTGNIAGTPAVLPSPWLLDDGYLLGPYANLLGANLSGATITNADLYGAYLQPANLSGTTWSNTICPDGTNSDDDPGNTCAGDLQTPPRPSPTLTGQVGAHGWFTSPVTVDWNWSDNVNGTEIGTINQSKCTTSTKSSVQGKSVSLRATCANDNGVVGTATRDVAVDTTPPAVAVTGVRGNHVYPVGNVPAAGCSTTDTVSGVAKRATVKITGISSHGTGDFTATCSGAVNKAGLSAAPVSVHYAVTYRFGGFIAPKPNSTLSASTRSITVKFKLDNSTSQVIPATWATALAHAGAIRVRFSGPNIAAVKALCSFTVSTSQFSCTIKVPKGIKTGKANPYRIAAQQNPRSGFVTVATPAEVPNPEIVYFKKPSFK